MTGLVAEKNAWAPADHAALYACGLLATLAALERTHPDGPTMEERLRALTFCLMRQLVGWPA